MHVECGTPSPGRLGSRVAAAIRVFDSVQRRTRCVRNARRKMYAADEPDGARRERCLVIAEESRGTRQGHCQIVRVNVVPKLPIAVGGAPGVSRDRQQFPARSTTAMTSASFTEAAAACHTACTSVAVKVAVFGAGGAAVGCWMFPQP